jgi:hypothetical protein
MPRYEIHRTHKPSYKKLKSGGVETRRIVSEIEDFGDSSDVHGCVKNGKLFEALAPSFCHSAAMNIAPRKTHGANNSSWFDAFLIFTSIH